MSVKQCGTPVNEALIETGVLSEGNEKVQVVSKSS